MTLGSCAREKEVAELLHRGQWPQASPPDLRAHVDACRSCSSLVLVTLAFQQARAGAASAARLESPGALWWRAQLRRRNADLLRIGKPILGAQIFALAVSLLVAAGVLASQARQGLRWMSRITELPGSLHLDSLWPPTLPSLGGSLMLLVPILATLALVSGVVVYLTTEKQ